MMERKKICFVVAVPGTANAFLRDHIKALQVKYDVYLVGNISNQEQVQALQLTGWHKIEIHRSISLLNDIKSLWKLYMYFRKMKFDAVHSVTPKAGLLCAISSWMARIKHRTHIFTGQVWATRTGVMRYFLKSLDRIIPLFDNHILVDGEPQRRFLIYNNVISEKNSVVLGAGSISGVNTERFLPSTNVRNEVRGKLGFNDDNFVFCFMGRQNKDKGIYELYEAFNRLVAERPNVRLLLFGSDEGDCMSHLVDYPHIKEGKNFIFYGNTRTPEIHLQASDAFCMPSYREGFGTSVIEASCLGLPVICSDIYGLEDTMVQNVTGLRCKVADSETLYQVMKMYVDNPSVALDYGKNGRERVLSYFAGEVITKCWVKWYEQILI